MSDVILMVAGIAAVLTGSRFALFACLMLAAHWWAAPSFGYYGGATLAAAAVVYAARVASPVPRKVRRIQLIALAFIPVQITGLIIWVQYLPPAVYNWACAVLYAALFIAIMTRDPGREHDPMDTAGDICFCVGSYRTAGGPLGTRDEGS